MNAIVGKILVPVSLSVSSSPIIIVALLSSSLTLIEIVELVLEISLYFVL